MSKSDYQWRGRRVLVTGSAGFLGTNLCLRLLDLGCEVTGTINKSEPQIEAPGLRFVRHDLSRPEECNRAIEGHDVVFMCAGKTAGPRSKSRTSFSNLAGNVRINLSMLEAIVQADVERTVFVSSTTIYPDSSEKLRESDAGFEFIDAYHEIAWANRFAEILCEISANELGSGKHIAVVRPSSFYGPFDDFEWETSHVLPALIRKVVERHDPIEVFGDGEDIRDFIYVGDVVEGMILAAENNPQETPINLSSGKGVTINEALTTILDVAGYQGAKISNKAIGDYKRSVRVIDPSNTEAALGFKASTTLQEGVAQTIDWYKASTGRR